MFLGCPTVDPRKGGLTVKKFKICYLIILIVEILLAFIFHEFNSFSSVFSFVPGFCVFLSVFLAIYYYREKPSDRGDREVTSFSSSLTHNEQHDLSMCLSAANAVAILFHLPIVFFVPSLFKLISVLLVFLTFVGGAVYFRIKHGKSVKSRLAKEDADLEEQKKKEELGRF